MQKPHILVVMGGPSEEHEVSLKSGFEVITHLDSASYDISCVVVDKQKQFFYAQDIQGLTREELGAPGKASRFSAPVSPGESSSIWQTCDLALLVLHGTFGEDGVIQGFLETLSVPYTGCGVTASAIGMHKTLAKKIFEASGIPTPPYSVYRHGDAVTPIISRHGFPCFVKAPQSGSSKLLGRADNREQLEDMLDTFIKEAPSVLVESQIVGDEFSCPVLEMVDGSIKALPPVFIKPLKAGHFFDYEAKYEGASEEIVPIPHGKEIEELIQKAALAVHKVLECRGLSRTDIIIHDGVPYVLEVNTLPGFTSQSLFPQAFAAQGGTFSELLDILVQRALRVQKSM